MIDVMTVVLVLVAALGYRWIVNRQNRLAPDSVTGPDEHSSMPEMDYVQPLEACEYNASKFVVNAGTGYHQGAFNTDVILAK
jgi:hypothetical protein